ncbi:MAG: hypothetical protein BMS9Abin36_1506 [Gammaproteobacteria bacterium]|nr:MAG: hypothetical protein BMS9Abin36_1506 [Gammaproteobacteria bacterium]
MGTLVAVPVYLLIAGLPLIVYLIVVLLSFIAGVLICGRTARDMGVHDHPAIVWDEFVGLWVALIYVPLSWWSVALGVALFRLFDIWKPQPIRWLDRHVGGGLGIMVDDVLAGIYALVALHVIVYGILMIWPDVA